MKKIRIKASNSSSYKVTTLQQGFLESLAVGSSKYQEDAELLDLLAKFPGFYVNIKEDYQIEHLRSTGYAVDFKIWMQYLINDEGEYPLSVNAAEMSRLTTKLHPTSDPVYASYLVDRVFSSCPSNEYRLFEVTISDINTSGFVFGKGVGNFYSHYDEDNMPPVVLRSSEDSLFLVDGVGCLDCASKRGYKTIKAYIPM